ncbi:AAA family ATPase [Photobacterium indicum]|uniref:AAA family ATPase n=1 Tax=Photobacterium indicum TaxID=81447 RepID=UPI003D0A1879
MKLEQVTIENYRCFELLNISFHSNVTVLIAPNGAGKTTIIDAARIAMWPLVKAFDLRSQTGKSATIQKDMSLSHLASIDLVPTNNKLSPFFSATRQRFGCISEQVLTQDAPELL